MTEQELAAIETRREHYHGLALGTYQGSNPVLEEDVPALIAEVRRLRKMFCCEDAASDKPCYCNRDE